MINTKIFDLLKSLKSVSLLYIADSSSEIYNKLSKLTFHIPE